MPLFHLNMAIFFIITCRPIIFHFRITLIPTPLAQVKCLYSFVFSHFLPLSARWKEKSRKFIESRGNDKSGKRGNERIFELSLEKKWVNTFCRRSVSKWNFMAHIDNTNVDCNQIQYSNFLILFLKKLWNTNCF